MDVIFSRRQATASEVLEGLPDPPSYSAVRALLAILEAKGHLKHTIDGKRYVYLPTRSREEVGQAALKRVLTTFFDGSAEKAVAALLESDDAKLPEAELDRLAAMIRKARKEGR